MRFLIVDANQVYSSMVKDVLENYVPDCVVDRAHNAAVLMLRLDKNCYDLILADIINCMDSEAMEQALQRTATPIIMWSFVNPGGYFDFASRLHARVLLRKPSSTADMTTMLRDVIPGSNPELKAILAHATR
jgi:DNA-binding NarL/FixJ family response regulator